MRARAVALMVVGPDPPISGADLELIEEVSREAGELIVIPNKADQSSPERLRDVDAVHHGIGEQQAP